MLVAITDKNEKIVLQTSMSPDKLKLLRKERLFFCPHCKTRVQLKIGSLKIPHFAHLTTSNCESRFSDGETEQHLLGKEHLYQLIHQLGYQVELESLIPTLKQRPDLLVHTKDNKQIAIEYQCSPISDRNLSMRNNGYLSANIKTIWIPSTPSSKKYVTTGICMLSFKKQLQQFIISRLNQNYLMTYNPYQRKFIYFSNLLHIKDNQFLTKIQYLPIVQQNFPFYVPNFLKTDEFSDYMKSYQSMKKRYLSYRLHISKSGVNDLFLRGIYELRLSLTNLPPFLGVPIKGNEYLGLFTVEWQMALFYYLQLNQIEVQSFNRQAIILFLKWAKLSVSNESIAVVSKYCKLLNTLNIHNVYSSFCKEQLFEELYNQFLA